MFRNNAKGSALITALFIMTLVAIAATAMSTRLQLDIYRTRLTLLSDKLYLASQAVKFWAFNELTNKQNKFRIADKQGKLVEFPSKLQTIYPSVLTKGALYDLQAKFNLNNLINKKNQAFFLNLLERTTKLSSKQRETLVKALRDWLSPYEPNQGANNFFNYYTQQKPTYFPAHQLMQNVSEFRLLFGVTAKVYQDLEGFIIALPESTPLNINTATKPLIMSLGDGLSEKKADKLIGARGEKGIRKLQDIEPMLKKFNIRQEQLTLESQYFLAVATTSVDDFTLVNYVIIKRIKDKKGKISLSVMSESLNSF